jgi:SAM-dependent methyltransferase
MNTIQEVKGTAGVQGELWGARARDWADIQEEAQRGQYPPVLDAADVGQGTKLLDVGCGTGLAAAIARERGATVDGIDASPPSVEIARTRVPDGSFRVGEMEALPYEDASFDVVASAVGAIFAPDHEAAARELARVCRPGGKLGLAAWRPETGFFPVTRRYRPPLEPGQGDPDDWGREEYAGALLGSSFELRFEDGDNRFEAASGQELWELVSLSAGPMKATLAELDAAGRREFHDEFVDLLERHRSDGGVSLPGLYLLVLGTRR